MRRTDRMLLIAAYILLVATVAWVSWDARHRLDRNLDANCKVAGAVLLSVFVDIKGSEGITPEDQKYLLQTVSILQDVCGDQLEDYEPPSISLPVQDSVPPTGVSEPGG